MKKTISLIRQILIYITIYIFPFVLNFYINIPIVLFLIIHIFCCFYLAFIAFKKVISYLFEIEKEAIKMIEENDKNAKQA